ncbi:hypothetical protein [Nocardioides sp. LHG3406-4]|uniref:hypothetical protein n=1 Tax=Nocardioides sp. LHG3406-4 TaxID=2804575 RepID=UPI003CEE1C85
MTLQVWNQKLRKAAADWEEQGDDLHGAGKTLAGAESTVDLLGSRVAPVATSFLATWGKEIQSLRSRANKNSTDLATTADEFLTSDKDTVDAMQRLLSWEDRNTLPVQPRGMR